VLVFAAAASACSCALVPEKQRYRQADAAFVGRLVSVRMVEGDRYGEAVFRFRVGRSYKRNLKDFVRVRSNTQGASCGIEPQKGRRYAMYLYRDDGRWTSNLCLQTTPRDLRRAAEGRSAGSATGCPGA
jgi:hypothetical protein